MSTAWKRTGGGAGAGKNGKEAQRSSEGEGQEVADEEEGLLDRPLWSYVSDRATRLLRQGLGDRCVLARPLCGVAGEAGEDFRGEKEEQDNVFFDLTLSLHSRFLSLDVACAYMVKDRRCFRPCTTYSQANLRGPICRLLCQATRGCTILYLLILFRRPSTGAALGLRNAVQASSWWFDHVLQQYFGGRDISPGTTMCLCCSGVPGTRGWNPLCPPPASVGGDSASGKRKTPPMLTIGLIVDATFAGRLVDKGPPAEDGPAARKFREFWGDKSELRR